MIDFTNYTSEKVDKILADTQTQSEINQKLQSSADNVSKSVEINSAAIHQLTQAIEQTMTTLNELSEMSIDLNSKMDIFVTS